ncbi:MAG: hypothetical protein J6O71_00435 [Lachnospiraceae bacterium]|nr:hypothetical protein [Lachnospiraceae bacterium]
MAVGKNSIKRAVEATGGEQSEQAKSAPAKAESVKKAAVKKAAKQASPKPAASKPAAPKPTAPEVKSAVVAKPSSAAVSVSKAKLYDEQADGVNAHYGINTPLPTFLL